MQTVTQPPILLHFMWKPGCRRSL